MVSHPTATTPAGPILHYIYDPLCGWCYGAAPLLKAARELLPLKLHGGGMMAGQRRQRVTRELRAFVMPHDRKIAQASGQPFGTGYFDGLLRDEEAVFDSEPSITAVLAADEMSGRGAELLARVQTAHYVEGRRIADAAVLRELARGIGIDGAAFDAAVARLQGDATRRHIAATQDLMARVDARGFPTLLIEREGSLRRLDLQAWYGRRDEWQHWLRQPPGVARAEPARPAPALCVIEGCST